MEDKLISGSIDFDEVCEIEINETQPDKKSELEIIFDAIQKNQYEIINEYMLVPNLFDGTLLYGQNIVTFSVINKSYGCLEQILKFYSPNMQNDDLNTGLHISVGNLDKKTTKILLENGADPNIKNINNETPIDLLIGYYPSDVAIDILRLLIENNANFTGRSCGSNTVGWFLREQYDSA